MLEYENITAADAAPNSMSSVTTVETRLRNTATSRHKNRQAKILKSKSNRALTTQFSAAAAARPVMGDRRMASMIQLGGDGTACTPNRRNYMTRQARSRDLMEAFFHKYDNIVDPDATERREGESLTGW